MSPRTVLALTLCAPLLSVLPRTLLSPWLCCLSLCTLSLCYPSTCCISLCYPSPCCISLCCLSPCCLSLCSLSPNSQGTCPEMLLTLSLIPPPLIPTQALIHYSHAQRYFVQMVLGGTVHYSYDGINPSFGQGTYCMDAVLGHTCQSHLFG